jgi:hypothetical protein
MKYEIIPKGSLVRIKKVDNPNAKGIIMLMHNVSLVIMSDCSNYITLQRHHGHLNCEKMLVHTGAVSKSRYELKAITVFDDEFEVLC